MKCCRLHYVGGWPRDCPREGTVEVKGEWLCVAHASGQARRDAHAVRQAEAYRVRQERIAVARARCTAISQALGITVETTGHGGDYGVVALDDLERLVDVINNVKKR
jgi:hypothetical protein